MKYIAIMGMGVVGGGVCSALKENNSLMKDIVIKYVLDRRDFIGHELEKKIVKDISVIVNDRDVKCVIETMGGIHPAYEFSLACINSGKSVVTSNKAVVEAYGEELEKAAEKHNVRYLYEASVGGGIPVIRPIKKLLEVNRITEICGILNGTTNFILDRMEQSGLSFEEALKEAQIKGYAEADPKNDTEGYDSARKLCILASVCFGKAFKITDCQTIEGIKGITQLAIESAKEQDCRIKLIACAKATEKGYSLSVKPCLVKKSNLLANVNGVFNCITVNGNLTGEVAFYGKGAGGMATASAILEDVTACFE